MNRGVWISSLMLILSAAFPRLGAQQTTWRSASRPTDKAVPQATVPGVSLEKPVPIVRGVPPGPDRAPRPFPTAYRNSQPLPRQVESARPAYPIAAVAQPGTVIAASIQPPVSGEPIQQTSGEAVEEGHYGEQFAGDRVVRPAPGSESRHFRPAANWKHPYPAEGGLPVEPAPVHANAPALPAPDGQAVAPGPWSEGVAQEGGTASRYYARADYLLWWFKNAKAPPLVTTGDLTGAPPVLTPPNLRLPGALDQPDTVSLFNGNLTQNPFSGARLTLGVALDDCGDKAIEVGGFILGERSKDFAISSAQVPGGLLTRPFFAANPGPAPFFPRELIEIVAAPGVAAGSVRISSPSRLWGLNADYTCKICCGCDYLLNALVGVRYLQLDESLTITEDLVPAAGQGFIRGMATDSFVTKNQFYGGQVGVAGRWWHGRFDVDGFAKLGLGSTNQTVMIDGTQVIVPPTGDTRPGGLLALNSNIGTFSRDKFAVVPEVGLTVGYHVTDRLRVSVGYNFLYWSSVVRPGDQIDRNLDITRIPNFANPFGVVPQPVNPPRPAVLFKDTDFWAHGLTAGVEIKF